MPRRSKRHLPTISLHTLTVPCSQHRRHLVLIAGLDNTARIAAQHAHRAMQAIFPGTTLTSQTITDEQFRAMYGDFDDDDVPF